MKKKLSTENDTQQLAKQMAQSIQPPALIFLEGPLGAGKTTFVRGFLAGLGFKGTVKSPTFTLVETYTLDKRRVAHFDLYRIKDPAELEALGIRDYFTEDTVCIIEWASKAVQNLPEPSILCKLSIEGKGRTIDIEGWSCD